MSKSNRILLDILHYAAVFAVLLIAWVPVMDFFKQELFQTSITVFIIFIISDKLAHKYILGEK